ncbi:UAA transporter [Amylostereum chailletii]|nr:UAA transporter [Amylostereum chailletii]
MLMDWVATFGLVFGGCCSNAVTLERLTSEHPTIGSLITFAQFAVVSIHGLRKFLVFTRGPFGLPLPQLRPRRVPLLPYIIQVCLFSVISLLNNAAFAYKIPMPVHIIFRSGGLVISMLMGWLISGKKYTVIQVVSVIVITSGVSLTTLSASHRKKSVSTTSISSSDGPALTTYLTGIAILTLALVLSGFLGLVQDHTYSTYGKRSSTASSEPKAPQDDARSNTHHGKLPDIWEESMFYLHFLSMPMFAFVAGDLASQVNLLTTSQHIHVPLPLPNTLLRVLPPSNVQTFAPASSSFSSYRLPIPSALPPLILNTLTQLLCVAGVNRLTTRVTALTVTLVLVVRKAVSLVLSVVLFSGNTSMDPQARMLLWGGAALVFTGTVGYTFGSNKPQSSVKQKDKDE